MTNPHLGQGLDEFLIETGDHAEAYALAVKRVIAFEIANLMHEQKLSKSEMARRMGTSRSSLGRLLDPMNPSVSLSTISTASAVLGKTFEIRFMDEKSRPKAA